MKDCVPKNMIFSASNKFEANGGQVVDRISELPDEVLISILSRLPIKEAARSMTLSRRWKKLWKFMICWTLTLQGTGRE